MTSLKQLSLVSKRLVAGSLLVLAVWWGRFAAETIRKTSTRFWGKRMSAMGARSSVAKPVCQCVRRGFIVEGEATVSVERSQRQRRVSIA
jgi:hypothetical protein